MEYDQKETPSAQRLVTLPQFVAECKYAAFPLQRIQKKKKAVVAVARHPPFGWLVNIVVIVTFKCKTTSVPVDGGSATDLQSSTVNVSRRAYDSPRLEAASHREDQTSIEASQSNGNDDASEHFHTVIDTACVILFRKCEVFPQESVRRVDSADGTESLQTTRVKRDQIFPSGSVR